MHSQRKNTVEINIYWLLTNKQQSWKALTGNPNNNKNEMRRVHVFDQFQTLQTPNLRNPSVESHHVRSTLPACKLAPVKKLIHGVVVTIGNGPLRRIIQFDK
jgi:hypothetical protein